MTDKKPFNRNFYRTMLAAGFVLFMTAAWLYPPARWLIPACMLAGIYLGVSRGRGPWCGNYCLRGNFLEAAGRLINPGGRIPAAFNRPLARYLVLAALMGLMTQRLYAAWPDARAMAAVFMLMLTATTAAALLLAVIFQRRAWCAVCPVGTISDACRGKLN